MRSMIATISGQIVELVVDDGQFAGGGELLSSRRCSGAAPARRDGTRHATR
jgi:hypothetical protein